MSGGEAGGGPGQGPVGGVAVTGARVACVLSPRRRPRPGGRVWRPEWARCGRAGSEEAGNPQEAVRAGGVGAEEPPDPSELCRFGGSSGEGCD